MSEKHYPYIGGSFDRIVFDGDGSVWVPEAEQAKLREVMADLWNDAVTRMDFVDRHEFIDKFLDRLRNLDMEVLEIDAFSKCGQSKL